jgi:hypothetical protein
MTKAFVPRLSSCRIPRLENPDDNTIADLYNKTPKAAAIASKKLEEKLLEQEYFLWEPQAINVFCIVVKRSRHMGTQRHCPVTSLA